MTKRFAFAQHPPSGFHAELSEIRSDLLALKACITAMRLIDEMKYSADQPRWPAGDPRGGQWMPAEGGEEGERQEDIPEDSESLSAFGEAPDGTPIEPVGGIPEDKLNWTTQQFMSTYCLGRIREVMPGQFLDMTILDVRKLAQAGDRSADRCMKLLNQNRFRKR
jgi:hypothetical protein